MRVAIYARYSSDNQREIINRGPEPQLPSVCGAPGMGGRPGILRPCDFGHDSPAGRDPELDA